MGGLDAIEAADGELSAPARGGADGQAGGERIDGAAFDSPALFVGLAAVEARDFPGDGSVGDAGGDDVGGDVGGILHVVRDRRDGIFGGRGAVGVGGRTEGGFAARAAVEVDGGAFAEDDLVEGGEFHEEIVRVLAVDDGDAVGGFAGGEEQRVALAGDGGGFGAEHGAEGEGAGSGAVRRALSMTQLVEKILSRPRGPD